ncbi:MAG TPA: IS3 family transposase [Chloroflexota bacterium]|nr:IS3 family transposase [Chloroflexota bacterium]
MPRKRFSTEQIVTKLRQAEVELSRGLRTPQVCKKLGVSEQTYYRWRKEYGGLRLDQAKRLKTLEQENLRLKKLVADQALDNAILKEVTFGKLLSPPRRRQAVDHVRGRLGVSERRACRVVGHARSTHRHQARRPDDEPRLVHRMIELATRYGRYGYRRITGLLRGEGWRVNHKRIERLWRREGLKVPQDQPKRGRLWLADGSCIRRRSEYRHHVWAYDFVADRTHDGRPLKILTVVDEYSRECLAIIVARRLRSTDVLETLTELFLTYGIPANIRSDNGSEFTAELVRLWLEALSVQTLFIEPGSPWENGYVESFNGKLRDELLDREIFYTLTEAKILIERWRREYNTVRPHSALGYRPPAPEAVRPVSISRFNMSPALS